MVESQARKSKWAKIPSARLGVSPPPWPFWLEILGLYLRRRGARERYGAFLQTHGLRGDTRIRHDRNRFTHQFESPVSRHGRFGRQSSSGARIQVGRRWRNPRVRRKRRGRLLESGRAPTVQPGGLAAHRPPAGRPPHAPRRKDTAQLAARLTRTEGTPARVERDLILSSRDRVELKSARGPMFHVELNEAAFARPKAVPEVDRLLRQP